MGFRFAACDRQQIWTDYFYSLYFFRLVFLYQMLHCIFKDRQQSIRPVLAWRSILGTVISLLIANIHKINYLKDDFVDYLMV